MQQLIEKAIGLRQKGHLADAEKLCEEILQANPNDCQTLCLLAELMNDTGRQPRAINLLHEAITIVPDDAYLHALLGLIMLNLGNAEGAIKNFGVAARLDPDCSQAHNALGAAYKSGNQLVEAISCYRKAIELQPDSIDAMINLGNAISQMDQFQEAGKIYEQVLILQPNDIDAYSGLGLNLAAQGEFGKAADCYLKVLGSNPNHHGLWNNLGYCRLAQGQLPESLEAFRKSANLQFDHGRPEFHSRSMFVHHLHHDTEQISYLVERGILGNGYKDYLESLIQIETTHANDSGLKEITLDADSAERILPSFNRILHYASCPAISSGALNPALNWSDIEARYKNSNPETVIIDKFLCPEALESLRLFCLNSTIWKSIRPYGYIGTTLGQGLSSPLILQIANELSDRLPNVLNSHQLIQAWAYKYDSQLRGINIHTDCAVVNVNFWITPDDANQDPQTGGLVLWDKVPPPEWGFLKTQTPDKSKIIEFLSSAGAKQTRIPHRQNRVVIFNSALFHASDKADFTDGYENRRINVTLLYGRGQG